ncbi:hypothetical protein RGCCGE502_05190 [Rhizobium grahamii CCGE 502]|uniref:Uncharacterized protein n=1 Tax=Rhizobium grahamii CCGE 502 TaxID=990285 RepID=S3I2Z5_9HYPH|nr:hypothetical protein RGCCGE502_05190 [Rhizobium grahamii CCGE 502]
MNVERAFFIVASFLLCAPAYAENSTETCRAVGETAKTVMEARQRNADMSKLMEIMDRTGEGKEFYRRIVILAYKRPAWHTQKLRDEAISQFSNDIQLACYQNSDK